MRSLDISILQTFQKVALLQSISRAADELYLSVSTVTGRIKALEDSLHIELFHRSGRRFELNEDGKRFLTYVDRFISIMEEGLQKVKLSKEGQIGELAIAVNPIIGSYLLPGFISGFRQDFPGIELRVIICPNYEVIEKITNGQAELGIMNLYPEEHGLDIKHWFEENWILVTPDRSLLRGRELTAKELEGIPLFAYGTDLRPWEIITDWYRIGGVRPRVIMELVHMEMIKNLMIEFQAISFLPRMAVLDEIQEGSLIEIPVFPEIKARSDVAFFHRTNLQLSATSHTLMDFASNYFTKGL